MPNGLFDNLNYLFDLNLSFNLIKNLYSFCSFNVEMSKLKLLDLNNNQIENNVNGHHQNLFVNCSCLTELKLNNNFLTNIISIDLNDFKIIDLSFNI